ncbi:hypothetical protein OSTOST_16041 [Ostertagia ostertagi]
MRPRNHHVPSLLQRLIWRSTVANLSCQIYVLVVSPLNKSNRKARLNEHHFAVPANRGDERRDFKLDTDHSRLAELQKRNSMLHPAMRCAYALEVGAYSSPTGSENAVKHGSARRKSGAKFFQRASSYVKKKFPLSESTNSQQ